MNNSGDRSPRRGRADASPEPGNNWWEWAKVGVGVAAGAALLAGGVYAVSQFTQALDTSQHSEQADADEMDTMENLTDAVSQLAVSAAPQVSNLNSLLNDLHIRYVAIRKEDLARHYNVFMKVFYPLHDAMKEVDPYYKRYSSRVQFAGSHYDRLRIKKPDEFDMDIVIGLPVSMHEHRADPAESDIVLEPKHAGFVQLRAGVQYRNILLRDGADSVVNKQAFLWMDDRNYILRCKFVQWFKSVVDRALNRFPKTNGRATFDVDGAVYTVGVSSSGPAYTLRIASGGFNLDVDLVPALRFPEARWLGGGSQSYRGIPPGCDAGFWMVVPKPNKFGANLHDEDRSWRVAMHDQERKFIHNSFHLRQANRLLKKLRDAQEMDNIASYYIKTLFLWKISELNDPSFWGRDVATIFKVMLKELHIALVNRKISYFWNKKNNLLERVPENILKGYANKVGTLLTKLQDDSNYMWAAKYLLTGSEYAEYEQLLQSYS